jgi:hypothetical protein
MNAKFLVKSILEIAGRGPFLVGDIEEGTIKIGMIEPKSALVIRSIDYVDDVGGRVSIALGFTGSITKEHLGVQFPAGTTVIFRE